MSIIQVYLNTLDVRHYACSASTYLQLAIAEGDRILIQFRVRHNKEELCNKLYEKARSGKTQYV